MTDNKDSQFLTSRETVLPSVSGICSFRLSFVCLHYLSFWLSLLSVIRLSFLSVSSAGRKGRKGGRREWGRKAGFWFKSNNPKPKVGEQINFRPYLGRETKNEMARKLKPKSTKHAQMLIQIIFHFQHVLDYFRGPFWGQEWPGRFQHTPVLGSISPRKRLTAKTDIVQISFHAIRAVKSLQR